MSDAVLVPAGEYVATPVYFSDSDRFEFVEKDCLCIYERIAPGIDYIMDVDGKVIGFSIDGSLLRHMMEHPTTMRQLPSPAP